MKRTLADELVRVHPGQISLCLLIQTLPGNFLLLMVDLTSRDLFFVFSIAVCRIRCHGS